MTTNEQTPTNGAVSQPIAKKTATTSFIPRSQFDVLALADSVLNRWEQTTEISLMWITTAEFKEIVDKYRIFLQTRMQVGSNRKSQTHTLQDLDAQINKAVETVKFTIFAHFGKEKGKSLFAEFGIIKQNRRYSIALDRNQRNNSLSMLASGIRKYNLQIVGFDADFFDKLPERYNIALQEAKDTDSTVSMQVGNKNDLRKQIEEVFIAIQFVIRANYPKTYTNELRGWGFHKEKY